MGLKLHNLMVLKLSSTSWPILLKLMYRLLGSDTVSSSPGQESFVGSSSFCCKACSIHSCHKELFQEFWISQQLLLNSILAAVHHAAAMSDLALISCKHSWRCHLDISGNHGIEESLLVICKRLPNECGSRFQGTLSTNGEKAAPIVGSFSQIVARHCVCLGVSSDLLSYDPLAARSSRSHPWPSVWILQGELQQKREELKLLIRGSLQKLDLDKTGTSPISNHSHLSHKLEGLKHYIPFEGQ